MVSKVKREAVALIVGALLGAMALMISSTDTPPLSLEIVEKVVEVLPEIGGQEVEIEIPDVTFAFPVAAEDWKITSPYGVRISPIYQVLRQHTGVDISVENHRIGMPQVAAIADGVIRDHWLYHETRGKYIVIEHDNGMVSHYSHLSVSYIHERRPNGERWRVKAGEVIGRMGATGWALGSHLHFELEIYDVLVNPMLYMDQVLPEWEAEHD